MYTYMVHVTSPCTCWKLYSYFTTVIINECITGWVEGGIGQVSTERRRKIILREGRGRKGGIWGEGGSG